MAGRPWRDLEQRFLAVACHPPQKGPLNLICRPVWPRPNTEHISRIFPTKTLVTIMSYKIGLGQLQQG